LVKLCHIVAYGKVTPKIGDVCGEKLIKLGEKK